MKEITFSEADIACPTSLSASLKDIELDEREAEKIRKGLEKRFTH